MSDKMSVIHGGPLADEPGQGALTIPGYIREVSERFTDNEAVVMYNPDGSRTSWTYKDLWDRSFEIAKALIAAGVEKDSRVGLLMTNRPEYLAGVYGIAMAGGVTVALSTFSTPSELEYLMTAGNVSLLLYDRQVLKKDFGAMMAELEPKILDSAPGELASDKFPFLKRLVALDSATATPAPPAPDGKCVVDYSVFLEGAASVSDAIVEARIATVKPSDTGAIFFSSGTTSLPKGIVHAQRALPIQWWRWPRMMDVDPVKHPVRIWTGNGFFWSGNISMIPGLAFSSGGAAILQPLFNADEALELIEKEKINFPQGRPHQWARFEESPKWATADLSSLHYVLYGAKLMQHPTVKTDWEAPKAFGTTETLTINTMVEANTPFEEHKGSYGQPLPGNILKIFDQETGKPVPIGERGEMAIKGPTLMLGYLGKCIDECFDDEGFFCTGDGGYVDENGYFFWEGRLTDMIKTGGANVSPVEIDLLLGKIPGIKRTETVGVPHETLGELVVTCVILHEGANLSEKDIIAHAKTNLASFKVPRAVLFFTDDEFTVTGSGKVKTGQLRDMAAKKLDPELVKV